MTRERSPSRTFALNGILHDNRKLMRQIREGHTFLTILAANGAQTLSS